MAEKFQQSFQEETRALMSLKSLPRPFPQYHPSKSVLLKALSVFGLESELHSSSQVEGSGRRSWEPQRLGLCLLLCWPCVSFSYYLDFWKMNSYNGSNLNLWQLLSPKKPKSILDFTWRMDKQNFRNCGWPWRELSFAKQGHWQTLVQSLRQANCCMCPWK